MQHLSKAKIPWPPPVNGGAARCRGQTEWSTAYGFVAGGEKTVRDRPGREADIVSCVADSKPAGIGIRQAHLSVSVGHWKQLLKMHS
jgi:hypothetical protein